MRVQNDVGRHVPKNDVVPQVYRHVPQRAASVPPMCRKRAADFAPALPCARMYTYGTRHGRIWQAVTMPVIKHIKHGCQEIVAAALDHWVCAITVHLDPWPLTPLGEVEALREGRRTYQMRSWGVVHRTAYRIAGKPPSLKVTVLAEHRCGQPIPSTWRHQAPPKKPTNNQEVQF